MVAISKMFRRERQRTLLQILLRFLCSSQVLELADQDLKTAVAIYEFLIEFIGKLRTRFEEFEAKSKKLSECNHYSQDVRRVRERNHRYNEPGTTPKLTQTPVGKFRTGTFFTGSWRTYSDDEVVSNAERLRQAYPTDLEASLSDELLKFSAFLKTDFAKWLTIWKLYFRTLG